MLYERNSSNKISIISNKNMSRVEVVVEVIVLVDLYSASRNASNTLLVPIALPKDEAVRTVYYILTFYYESHIIM